MVNKLTTHRAASLERQAWIAKLKRESKNPLSDSRTLAKLMTWGVARVRRFEKKKGGLGK